MGGPWCWQVNLSRCLFHSSGRTSRGCLFGILGGLGGGSCGAQVVEEGVRDRALVGQGGSGFVESSLSCVAAPRRALALRQVRRRGASGCWLFWGGCGRVIVGGASGSCGSGCPFGGKGCGPRSGKGKRKGTGNEVVTDVGQRCWAWGQRWGWVLGSGCVGFGCWIPLQAGSFFCFCGSWVYGSEVLGTYKEGGEVVPARGGISRKIFDPELTPKSVPLPPPQGGQGWVGPDPPPSSQVLKKPLVGRPPGL